jgi:hypothetical protein
LFFLFLAALTATQCVTYDHAKRFCVQITGWEEGIKLHLGASLITGLVTRKKILLFLVLLFLLDLLQRQLLHHWI